MRKKLQLPSNKMLQPPSGRPIVSIRELLLLVAVVIAGFSWFQQYNRANKMARDLDSANRMFEGMMGMEEKLRQDPSQKAIHMSFMEFGRPGPKLQWSMEVKVLDPVEGGPVKDEPVNAEAAKDVAAKDVDGEKKSGEKSAQQPGAAAAAPEAAK
jgi:hypothetical protein